MIQPEDNAKPMSNTDSPRDASTKARLASGVVFLRAADKKQTTLSFRVAFLKSKGFSAEEIHQCFETAGQPQSIDSIHQLFTEASATARSSNAPGAVYQPNSNSSPYLALPPPRDGFGWKDYFIAATIGSVAGFILFKLASSWLPWEITIRPKGTGGMIESRKRRERERLSSSGLDASRNAANAQSTVSAEASVQSPTPDGVQSKSVAEELALLKAELAEKSEQCTKVMREKMELTVKAAQTKSQQAQSARALENANKKIADLEAKLEEASRVVVAPTVGSERVDSEKDQKEQADDVKPSGEAVPVSTESVDS